MKTALVTGGTGFVGQHLVRFLIEKEHKVIVVDDLSNSEPTKFDQKYCSQFVPISTSQIKMLGYWLQDVEVIFHLGEFSRIHPSFEKFDEVVASNVMGTLEVLKIWKQLRCKLIYAGSSTKFCGYNKDDSPYTFTKSMNCDLIQDMANWFGLDYSICYFYNVFGPNCEGKLPGYQSVVDVFYKQKRAGEPLTVAEPGTQTREFVHVSDVVDGLYKAWQFGIGKEWHLRSGDEISILELANLFSPDKIQMIPPRKADRMGSPKDVPFPDELGWKPKVKLQDYIQELLKDA